MQRAVLSVLLVSCCAAVSEAQQTTRGQVVPPDSTQVVYDIRVQYSANEHPTAYLISRADSEPPRAPDSPAASVIACGPICHVDANAVGLNDGTSWMNAFTSLSDALSAADASVTEIRVAQGTYKPDPTGLADPREARFSPFWKAAGATLRGGYAGLGAANPDARDPVTFQTILSGDLGVQGVISDNTYNVVRANGVSSALMDGFVIRDGNADGALNSGFDIGGGAFFAGSATLRDLTFRSNVARFGGGGAYITFSGTDDAPVLERCRFEDNVAGSGGGLMNFAALQAIVRDSTFERNAAIGIAAQFIIGCGGAVNVNPGNTLAGANRAAFINTDFISNSADLGGAIESGGSPSMTNVRFLNNFAASEGGGFFGWGFRTLVPDSGEVSLLNATVCDNASVAGGAGFSLTEGILDVQNSIFWGNAAFALGELGNTQIALREATGSTVAFSDVEGGWQGGGANNVDVDPMISPDGHLLAASPLINAGDPSFVPDPTAASEGDGDLRLVGLVDIGADEFQDTDGDALPDYWEAKFSAALGRGVTGLNCGGDIDGDGLTNCQEYELYSSDPALAPIYVDPVIGDDANDGTAAAIMGVGVGPKATLRAAMGAAARGTTILAATGEYSGPDNRALDFKGKGMVLRAVGGSSLTSINLEGMDRAFNFSQQETSKSAIVGFKIINGMATRGGAFRAINASVPQLRDVVLENNAATEAGAALFVQNAGMRLTDVIMQLSTVATRGELVAANLAVDVADFRGGHLRVDGPVTVKSGTLRVIESCVDGPSAGIDVQATATLEAGELIAFDGTKLGFGSSLLRANVSGQGELRVFPEGVALRMDGSASATARALSVNRVDNVGKLTMRAATLQNVSAVDSKRVRFETSAAVSASATGNTIQLLESNAGFGGETAIGPGTTLSNNTIESIGDRIFNLDPDPTATVRPTLDGNIMRMKFTTSPFAGSVAGGVSVPPKLSFELRTRDVNTLAQSGSVAAGGVVESGAFELPASVGYSDVWAFDRVEIDPSTQLALTNRRGFDFRTLAGGAASLIPVREAIYVKNLILGNNAVLNTARQRLYYQSLQLGVGARIVDTPLHGLSLKKLGFVSDTEFTVRVRARLTDAIDFVPSNGMAPAAPLPRGSVDRFNNKLRLRTHDPLASFFSASSVSAKAEFARVGEEDVMVTFRYRFLADPNSDARLLVYLSDKATPGDGNLLLASIAPSAVGRRGSIGSTEMATFVGTFSRGTLNLRAASFLEFKLAGKDSELYLDDIKPIIRCLYQNKEVSGDEALSNVDFLYVVDSLGRDPFRDATVRTCFDPLRSADQRIDVEDLLQWDIRLDEAIVSRSVPSDREPLDGTVAAQTILPSNRLVLSAKSTISGNQQDALYSLKYASISVDGAGKTILAADAFGDPTQLPASTPSINGFRANGRMTRDILGDAYQIHGRQGLLRLRDNALRVPPREMVLDASTSVRVGLLGTGGTVTDGNLLKAAEVPFLDAAFSRVDPDVVYVAPVMVIPTNGVRYKAAARLRLQAGDPPYVIERIYGRDPLADVTVTTDPAGVSQIDVQRIREVEVGGNNRLYLLSTKDADQNDWLLVYDVDTGNASEERFLLNAIAPGFRNPAAMRALSDGTTLAIATSADQAAGTLARLYKFRFDPLAGGVAAAALSASLEETVEIANMDIVTAIAEGPGGALLVSGLKLPPPDEFRVFLDTDPLFTVATLAVVCSGHTNVEAAVVDGYPISLPLGTIATCKASECPDLCALVPADPPVAGPNTFDRTLEIILPASSAGTETAYRVTLGTLYNPVDPQPTGQQDYSAAEGTVRYLNLLRDGSGNPVTDCLSSAAFNTTYKCAAVGCTPEFADWGTLFGGAPVYVVGNAIIPDSTFTVAHLAAGCVGNEATCSAASAEVPFTTARFGDSQPDGAVNVTDVVNTVDVVKQVFGSLPEYHVYVRNANPIPQSEAVNVTDIVLHVDALKLVAYKLPISLCP